MIDIIGTTVCILTFLPTRGQRRRLCRSCSFWHGRGSLYKNGLLKSNEGSFVHDYSALATNYVYSSRLFNLGLSSTVADFRRIDHFPPRIRILALRFSSTRRSAAYRALRSFTRIMNVGMIKLKMSFDLGALTSR